MDCARRPVGLGAQVVVVVHLVDDDGVSAALGVEDSGANVGGAPRRQKVSTNDSTYVVALMAICASLVVVGTYRLTPEAADQEWNPRFGAEEIAAKALFLMRFGNGFFVAVCKKWPNLGPRLNHTFAPV